MRRCKILDFWHALEHAWELAHLRYGAGSAHAGRWVHDIAERLRAGKVEELIEGLKRPRPKTPESRQSLQALGLIRQAGMRWREAGARRLLALRLLLLNHNWELSDRLPMGCMA